MNTQNNQSTLEIIPNNSWNYEHLSVRDDPNHKATWGYMHASPRPSFTLTLLNDLNAWLDYAANETDNPNACNIDYLVLASKVPNTFNLGGDLNYFRQLIANRDVQGLYDYGKQCVALAHRFDSALDRDMTTIALVQGNALGGGFESALSANVLVAERSARLGFPEILFNLFPGMGAYSFISRRIDARHAKQMILSGRIYSGEELHEMGLVDVLAEDGEGEAAVRAYIKQENRARNGYRALQAAIHHINPVNYDELLKVVEIWANAALKLQSRDLRMMERLVMRQSTKHGIAA